VQTCALPISVSSDSARTIWRSPLSVPLRMICPLSGFNVPSSRCSNVDLPTPLRPTIPVRSCLNWRSMPVRTGRPSGVDQLIWETEMEGMGKDFPGGGAGWLCCQVEIHDRLLPCDCWCQNRVGGAVLQGAGFGWEGGLSNPFAMLQERSLFRTDYRAERLGTTWRWIEAP